MSGPAKEWGSVGKRQVLGIHGWLDNSGSFDKLVALLPLSDLHIVAIDLPGHGLSSHKPPGMLYGAHDWIVDIRRVISHLGWKEYSIIGHSMGAGIGVVYSAFYSSEVKKFVALDNIRPYVQPRHLMIEQSKKVIEQLFTNEARSSKPPSSYTLEEAIEMTVNAMGRSCSEESAKMLLKRGARVMEGGRLVFNRDSRLKLNYFPAISKEEMEMVAETIRCDYMLIEAKNGTTYAYEPVVDLQETLELFKKSAKSFEIVQIEGTHHVHLNNPERVSSHIIRFLNK